MKNILYVLIVVIIASACGGPKYTASFNYYDKPVNNQVPTQSKAVISEQTVVSQPEQLLASTSSAPVEIKAAPKEEVRKTYIQMTKNERKALRTHLKSEIKSYVKEQKKNLGIESAQATSAMDNDLKLAAIFGAVGIVGLMIPVDAIQVIGAIALLVGVVFLIKWLVRQ